MADGAPPKSDLVWSDDEASGSERDAAGRDEEEAFLRAVGHAPPVDPAAARRVAGAMFGRYRILREIGRGGMGAVLEAEDMVLARRVALKLLPDEAGSTDDDRARLLAEARAATAARHPGLATVYDAGTVDGHVFLAMELVLGTSLRERLSRADAPEGLPLAEALRITAEVARATHAVHEAGFVHRDIKPDNVMIEPCGAVKLVDFGLASAQPLLAAPAPKPGRFAGTRAYAAPEQRRGDAIDARADQHAIGVLLHELVTGKRSGPDAKLAEAVRRGGLRGRDARALIDLVARCCAERPADRYPSAAVLAAHLDGLAARQLRTRSAKGLRARRALLGATSIALAAGLAALSWPRADAAAPVIARPPTTHLLACPQLEVVGPASPGDWLGAAAANVACRRARVLLGGGADRVIPPAALLDLPGLPRADFPDDPFRGARTTSLAAARQRAPEHLDGTVESRGGELRVHLALRLRDGTLTSSGEGRGPDLLGAVRGAMDTLGLAKAPSLDAATAQIQGYESVDRLLVATDFELRLLSGAGLDEEEQRLQASPRGPIEALLLARSMPIRALDRAIVAPPVDRASPEAFARTAIASAVLDPAADAPALAAEAALSRERCPPSSLLVCTAAEAMLRAAASDEITARGLALHVAERDPMAAPWSLIALASYAQPGFAGVGRAYAAWMPEAPDAYNIANQSPTIGDAERLALLARAYVLAPDFPLFAGNYGVLLLRSGRREEVRPIAGRLLAGGPAQRMGGERLTAAIALHEGRVGAGLARLREVLGGLPAVGRAETGDLILVATALELAAMVGRSGEVARALAERFVLAKPPRLYPGIFAPALMAQVCALADDVSAPCFTSLRALVHGGFFRDGQTADTPAFLDGAERYARGDVLGAATAFRRLAGDLGYAQRDLVATAFDDAGDLDRAERVDAPALGRGLFGGIGLAEVRAARRAQRRGDLGAARRQAQAIVDAWSGADEALPAVAAMEALLRLARTRTTSP